MTGCTAALCRINLIFFIYLIYKLSLQSFRAGMHKYLTQHQYGNTKTEDLWEALGSEAKKPVGEVMSGWTKQMGFPVISVSSTQDGENRILNISQKRFLVNKSAGRLINFLLDYAKN